MIVFLNKQLVNGKYIILVIIFISDSDKTCNIYCECFHIDMAAWLSRIQCSAIKCYSGGLE